MVEYYFLSMITDFRLKVFETVARRLNFTRAAEELFITQPAVTRHIKELERLLDARLFKREGRGIALTAEGVRLLAHSRRILKEYETLAEEISFGRNSPVSGELSLGASSTMSQYVLPPLLALFNRAVMVAGVPLLYLYVFLAWALLITLLALVVEKK